MLLAGRWHPAYLGFIFGAGGLSDCGEMDRQG